MFQWGRQMVINRAVDVNSWFCLSGEPQLIQKVRKTLAEGTACAKALQWKLVFEGKQNGRSH